MGKAQGSTSVGKAVGSTLAGSKDRKDRSIRS